MAADTIQENILISPGTDEFEIWSRLIRPRLGDLSENVLRICTYGFTEILNNVIDHADSPTAALTLEVSPGEIELAIVDQGTGIFRKIQAAAGLANEHEALLELAKGRFTTDPDRHTGEGIFFTARMFDRFCIVSGTMYVSFKADGDDWVIEEPHRKGAAESGTGVIMAIDPASKRTTRDVFDRFAPMEGESFSEVKRVRLAIKLAQPGGEPLVSRSQAKRILARLEQFQEAILDFEGVPEIGPAFADEIFRVFAQEHPGTSLIPVGAGESVMRMIVRAQERNGTSGRNRS